jgi:hypothetical protein
MVKPQYGTFADVAPELGASKLEVREIVVSDDGTEKIIPNFKGCRRGGCELELSSQLIRQISDDYDLDQLMIKKAITPEDDLVLPKEEFQVARDELSRELLKLPQKKDGTSGRIGPDAVIPYLAAMMVEAIGETKEAIPRSLIELLRNQLCGSNPKLMTFAQADNIEVEAIGHAIAAFEPGETISIREGARRLGISEPVMRQLIKKKDFNKKVCDHRDFIGRWEEFRKTEFI